MADQRKVKLLLKLRTDVAVAWIKTRDAFIEIGRALNDVDRELDPVERDRFKAGFRQLFPFSETVASQSRAIARAVMMAISHGRRSQAATVPRIKWLC